MTMTGFNAILVVLAEQSGAEAALSAAYRASLALDRPRITALHVRVDPKTTILPTEEMLTEGRERALRHAAAREAETLHAIYEAWRRPLDPALSEEWRDVVGTEASEVAKRGSGAALLVMASPTPESLGHAHTAFHAALFETHRPLLMVPPAHEPRAVRRIAIGWQDSEVCRRAIQAAAPWLRQAEDVRIVHVGEAEAEALRGVERLFADSGVRVTARSVRADGLTDGERLLAEAEAADWLVIGAYRHNRLINWVLGGVTNTVLNQAQLPVFMVH